MSGHDVAFVGTGPDPENPSRDGFAMAYQHAAAYERLDGCRLVGCADIVRENAVAFAEAHDVESEHVYEDYERMLDVVEPDVVSVCTPPATHAELVAGCASSGGVDAIHCEKPMAKTWGAAREMVQICDAHDVQLTFNHMRRFADVFRATKRRLDAGAIGVLQRVEYTWGNFFDNGTHAIDLCTYFADEASANWVIAQLDYREEDVYFGTHNENQVFACWKYDTGVFGIAATGPAAELTPGDFRLVGTEGTIDVHFTDELLLRVQTADGTETAGFDELTADGVALIDAGIEEVVRSLDDGTASELDAANALTATEIIFAGYESVRRRGRVDLPLEVDDNPLETMVAEGDLTPRPPRS